jgi:diaminopimelate decarboxylase/aspartate kinase
MDTARDEIPWWRVRQAELLGLAGSGTPRYVYDTQAVLAAVAGLKRLKSVDRLFYAMKANPHPAILTALHTADIGFETVSPGELARVHTLFPDLPRDRLLFTPNFAPRGEYAAAFSRGVRVTLDNLHPLREWPELLQGSEVFLRVDTGEGAGHHVHVRTAGEESKFGIPLEELPEARALADELGVRIAGFHAHLGSGILDAGLWCETAAELAALAESFPEVRALNLGGGLGIAEHAGEDGLDLAQLDAGLAAVKRSCPHLQFWLEPGRYLVARAGVLLARVTQLKGKGRARYLGVDAGMNSLIRPALYGAFHEIVNLSRDTEPARVRYSVVGPICESGDVLGVERLLPESREGDVLLIADTGAYGHAMSSHYNLRKPAEETVL